MKNILCKLGLHKYRICIMGKVLGRVIGWKYRNCKKCDKTQMKEAGGKWLNCK